ncbi:MAG TPA: hypothetical protein DEH78_18870 [Solibacterales bacterium]|nr:hypothetical protein [Bryobacterales bacterium]
MKALEHEISAKQDPRRMSGVQLARLGVQILNKYDLSLQCMSCGEVWSPPAGREGALATGYWVCPNKCNL